MKPNRLEAFTDGVVAIIITIMVLELKVPEAPTLNALAAFAPIFLAYVLSFVNVGLYWNNHHHMFHASDRIDGRVLWANLFLLFWLSLVPFVIRWLDEASFAPLPTAAYGIVLGFAAVGWMLTEAALIRVNGRDSRLSRAVGATRKEWISLVGYVVAVPVAFLAPAAAIALYILVSALWLVPDRRLERAFRSEGAIDERSTSVDEP